MDSHQHEQVLQTCTLLFGHQWKSKAGLTVANDVLFAAIAGGTLCSGISRTIACQCLICPRTYSDPVMSTVRITVRHANKRFLTEVFC